MAEGWRCASGSSIWSMEEARGSIFPRPAAEKRLEQEDARQTLRTGSMLQKGQRCPCYSGYINLGPRQEIPHLTWNGIDRHRVRLAKRDTCCAFPRFVLTLFSRWSALRILALSAASSCSS